MNVQAIIKRNRSKAEMLQTQASILSSYMAGVNIEWYSSVDKNWVPMPPYETLSDGDLPTHHESHIFRRSYK